MGTESWQVETARDLGEPVKPISSFCHWVNWDAEINYVPKATEPAMAEKAEPCESQASAYLTLPLFLKSLIECVQTF